MQHIKSKTRRGNTTYAKTLTGFRTQKGGSGRSSRSRKNNNNNNLQRRLLALKLPDVPDTHTTPIPKSFRLADVRHYVQEISTKTIPTQHQIDRNTEQIILFNLMKLQNIKDEFSSFNSLYACIELIINLVGDKIIQLSKLLPDQRSTRTSVSGKDNTSKVIRAWIEFFMALQTLLRTEKDKIQKYL
jgi:hypothetical protein